MFIPFLVIIPGMTTGVLIPEIVKLKGGSKFMGVGEEALANLSSHAPAGYEVSYNDAMLLMIRDLLPNGLLGLAIAGLLASFMAGMAANVSAFNTVFTVDIYEAYFKPNESDEYYLKVGRNATIVACTVAVFTALIASLYPNIMDCFSNCSRCLMRRCLPLLLSVCCGIGQRPPAGGLVCCSVL